MSRWVYLNDRFVDRTDATISIFDHGFLYGDGVYETLRAYGGRIFLLEKHLSRLERSAQLIGLTVTIARERWPAVLGEALHRNALQDAYLRITISRGEGEIGLDPHLCPHPTVAVIVKPALIYPHDLYLNGVTIAVVTVRRNLAAALPPRIKSLNFLNNILAKREATAGGAFDGLMLNAADQITECTASNIFFVREGRLCTPALDCGILDGITREVVLRLAQDDRIPTEEGTYPETALLAAQECFLTNTSMEIMPVRSVNGKPIGAGRPGPLTERLRRLFRANLDRFLEPVSPQ